MDSEELRVAQWATTLRNVLVYGAAVGGGAAMVWKIMHFLGHLVNLSAVVR